MSDMLGSMGIWRFELSFYTKSHDEPPNTKCIYAPHKATNLTDRARYNSGLNIRHPPPKSSRTLATDSGIIYCVGSIHPTS